MIMSRFFRSIILSSACILGIAAAFSCTEIGGDVPPAVQGNSIFVPNVVDTTVTFELTFESDWHVQNNELWFAVTPLSGSAGTVQMTVRALETNSSLSEKVSTFDIVSGETTRYYVIQDVTPGSEFKDVYTMGATAGDYSMTFSTNRGEVTLSTQADWLTLGEITSEATQLADGSVSKLVSYTQSLTVTENTVTEPREAVVTVSFEDGTTQDVTVRQSGPADFGSTFLRRSVAFRFTADWCGYCPNMNIALHNAIEQRPDNLIAVNFYDQLGSWGFSGINQFMNLYGVNGFPAGIFNGYGTVRNYSEAAVTSMFVNLTDEAAEQLPASTAISGSMSLSNGVITVDAQIAAKESGEYIVAVLLMEDGYIGYQANYYTGNDNEYQHDNIARLFLTENPTGDRMTLEADNYTSLSYTVEVPDYVVGENTHVVIYVSKEGNFSGSVGQVIYGNYGSYVDNAVSIPVNGSADFAYQN